VGDNEAVEIEVETVLHGGAIDLGGKPARRGELLAVETDALADCDQFAGRLPRMGTTPAANVNAERLRPRIKAPLQRADHRRGDAGRMPVHPHDRAETLKPERVGEAREEFVAAV